MKSNTSTKRTREEKNEASQDMIDVKEAARVASEYFASLYPEEEYSDVQLEEVELTEDGKHWLITLSYTSKSKPTLLSLSGPRKYKLFKIEARTGKVQAMKMRSVA